jgi:superfamily I DNA/RNA helicase/RecB family exonuclease
MHGMSAAVTSRYRLVTSRRTEVAAPDLDSVQRQVVEHRAGPLLVLGGPGTGKTTALVEAVVARIDEGVDPATVLVLTLGRKSAGELRERIAARLGRTTTEPVARTFHSYAFGVLRLANPDRHAPRLLTGPEQDLFIRELVEGDRAGDGIRWPDRLRPALGTVGFAAELRDLLLRAYERDVAPTELARLGRARGRDDWVAAGAFQRQYEQVMDLRDAGARATVAYDTAYIARNAAAALLADPALLEAIRPAAIYVDEFAETDPAQLALLTVLGMDGRTVVAAADPDQSVYAFRGADPKHVDQFGALFPASGGQPTPTVLLRQSYRGGPRLTAAYRRVAARLRGRRGPHRDMLAADQHDGVEVHVLRSPAQEAAYIAHRLREAHLRGGVPWREMAVVVRSTVRALAVLRRAMLSAGVPVEVAGDELPLPEQPAVAPLLRVLQVATRRAALTPPVAEELLTSPLGGADALGLRRLKQALRQLAQAVGDRRSSGDLLVDALANPRELATVTDRWAAPARRVAALTALVRSLIELPDQTVEDVLWKLWQASGLAERWADASAAGGPRGAAADRDLDSVVALFATAARFTDRMPGAGVPVFLDAVSDQQVPADTLAPAARRGESVQVLTAHSAKGREWELVVVAGVEEGVWPDLRPRGSLLGSEELVDLRAGLDPDIGSPLVGLLDEERRLFGVAISRASRRLVVTAVEGEDGEHPSRFLDDLVPPDLDKDGTPLPRPITDVPRALTLPGLVAELRTVVGDQAEADVRRRAAAHQLARLADSGVPGADPSTWWGLLPLSDAGSLRGPDEQVRVSPSRVEQFGRCALRWLLESTGGTDKVGAPQGLGTLVHAAAASAVDAHTTEAALNEVIDAGWAGLDLGGPWFALRERERVRGMLRRLVAWLRANPRRTVAVEEAFTVAVGRALITGRVDRLERDERGRLVVVDLKTGKNPPPDRDVPANPQLGVYQLAVEKGAFPDHGNTSGGASLVHLTKSTKGETKAKEQVQAPLAESGIPGWAAELVEQVAEGMAGSVFTAVANEYCRTCPVRTSCPIDPAGRGVTQ